jgi:hypothetical protein
VFGDKPPVEVIYALTPFGRRFMGTLDEVRRLQAAIDTNEIRSRGVAICVARKPGSRCRLRAGPINVPPPAYKLSANVRSLSERLGCFSLRIALASI